MSLLLTRKIPLPARMFLLVIQIFLAQGAFRLHAASADERIEEQRHGDIGVKVVFSPGVVDPRRDMLVVISVTAPEGMDIHLQPMADRFQGFTQAGRIDGATRHTAGGAMLTEWRFRLVPEVVREYRLAPFAVYYSDGRQVPALDGWFMFKPVVLERAGLLSDGPLEISLDPVWIYPAARVVMQYILLGLLLMVILAAAFYGARRLRRKIMIMRMSPRERAMFELDELRRKNMPSRGLVKEFYLELTMIVRRYIEGACGIRAPEQTTEEFLAAAAGDTRFAPCTIGKLKTFLESADLVKFAAYRPDDSMIGRAFETAADYVRTDVMADRADEVLSDPGTGEAG